nr:PAS domain S-box protein [Methanomicrobium sp. W14]
MIVEDEALIGMSLRKVLTKMGYLVTGVAGSGEEAFSFALSSHPDVILMDIRIKGNMDGIEAAERINREFSVPVIYVTAYNDDECIERCIKSGLYGFLTKPAAAQEIKAAIETAVERHRAHKAEEEMRKKEAILRAVGFAAEKFLSGGSFEKNIKEALLDIGKAAGFERIYLYRCDGIKAVFEFSLFCYWENETFCEDFMKKDVKNLRTGRMDESFLKEGKTTFWSSEILDNYGLGALFLSEGEYAITVPVYACNRYWGFLCFISSGEKISWSAGEKEGLCATASLLGSAISSEMLKNDIVSSEKKYRSLYNLVRIMCDNVPDMIWAEDENRRCTFANLTFCRKVLGRDNTKEPVGKSADSVIEDEKQKNPENSFLSLMESHAHDFAFSKEKCKSVRNLCSICSKGKFFHYDVCRTPFFDDDGVFAGLVWCGRDITHEKEFEKNLVRINTRFVTFMDKLPACAYIRDKNGKILYSNRYTKNVFFYEGNLDICFIPEIFGENDPCALDEVNKKVFEYGPAEMENTFILRDGNLHTFKFILFPVSCSNMENAVGAIGIDITDTREAELSLHESEQNYRILFENVNDAIYVGDGRVCVDCNLKMSRLLGYERNEIIGRSIPDFSPEYQPNGMRSDDYIHEIVRLSSAGKNPDFFDWVLVKKNGNILYTRISINAATVGPKNRFFLVIRDVTDKKRSEEALKESEMMYKSLVNNSPIGIEIFQDQKIVYVNPSVSGILSMSPEDLMNRSLPGIVHKDDVDYILDINNRRLAGISVPDCYKIRVIDGEGHIRIVELNVVVIEWNKRPATLNFLTDVTEKEKSEEALRESEERYRSVVENARINIIIARNEKFCYVNPSAAEFLGFSNEKLFSRSFIDFICRDDREKVIEIHKKMFSGTDNPDVTEKSTIRAWNCMGEVRILDFNAKLIQWNGKPATLNFLVDITDQIKSAKVTEKALMEKTVLLQEVHHRVKNNLALIISLLSVQARSADTKDVANSLRDAETRIFSIAAVHESLYRSSSISTVSAGEHLRNLGEEIIGNYSADVKISLDVDGGECQLGLNLAIPISLVVNELLINSIKYAFSGRKKGRIYIFMNCSGDFIDLVVGDDGKGIPNDFDLLKTHSLGMTLVRNIVTNQLDGTIELKEGKGTEWVIRIPRNDL